jgi:hypothetical protein
MPLKIPPLAQTHKLPGWTFKKPRGFRGWPPISLKDRIKKSKIFDLPVDLITHGNLKRKRKKGESLQWKDSPRLKFAYVLRS